jgi:hypothetical protein
LTVPSAAKAKKGNPRSMKPPDALAAISQAKHADLAAACIANISGGAGVLFPNQIESRNSP